MRPAAARLLLTAVLFLGWIGYLAYQVATLPRTAADRPLVLSRPQILTSQLDVLADVPEGRGDVEVTVAKVLYPPDDNAPLKEGDRIVVTNIEDCRPPTRGHDQPDWTGPGRYLLPLRKADTPAKGKQAKPRYEVAPIPPSPGYAPPQPLDLPATGSALPAGPPRIYPDTRETEAQYRQIAKPES